jgi:hypothetical protein
MDGQTDTLKLRVSQFCERTVKMGETFHDLFQIHFVSLSPVDALSYLNVLLTVNLSIFISVFNQFDAQNLFHNRFYFMPLQVGALPCTNLHSDTTLLQPNRTNTPVHTETEQYAYIQSPAPEDECNSIRNMLSNKKTFIR